MRVNSSSLMNCFRETWLQVAEFVDLRSAGNLNRPKHGCWWREGLGTSRRARNLLGNTGAGGAEPARERG